MQHGKSIKSFSRIVALDNVKGENVERRFDKWLGFNKSQILCIHSTICNLNWFCHQMQPGMTIVQLNNSMKKFSHIFHISRMEFSQQNIFTTAEWNPPKSTAWNVSLTLIMTKIRFRFSMWTEICFQKVIGIKYSLWCLNS